MNDKELLEKILEDLDVKDAELLEVFEDDEKTTSLYMRFEKPLKFSVSRKEGFCVIIADAMEISRKALDFVVDEFSVLTVKWNHLINVKWKDCPEEDYLEELKKYGRLKFY